MGYTHYWTQLRDFTEAEWHQVQEDVMAIVIEAGKRGIRLADSKSDINHVEFNGYGDDAHETFWMDRVKPTKVEYPRHNPAWNFCKTAAKPYDTAVTAVLCYLSTYPDALEVTSDGEPEDWVAGLALARTALPRLAGSPTLAVRAMDLPVVSFR